MCNIFLINSQKDYKMAILIKNAETLFERFETKIEMWAEKLF